MAASYLAAICFARSAFAAALGVSPSSDMFYAVHLNLPGNSCVCWCGPSRVSRRRTHSVLTTRPPTAGKLKEIGNSILGNFGLSLDNIKTKKDPETGSYNISFG